MYHRGKCVVDLMGGWRDKDHSVPYDADSLQVVFSTTKGITSIAVAMCVERGFLELRRKVATYWPEFAAQVAKVTSLLRNCYLIVLVCTQLMVTSRWKMRLIGTPSQRDLPHTAPRFPR